MSEWRELCDLVVTRSVKVLEARSASEAPVSNAAATARREPA
jgi:hypothetical protein